jgi:hypothetical protein
MIDVIKLANGFYDYLKPCDEHNEAKILELGMRGKFSEEAIKEGLHKIVVAAPDLIRRTLWLADSLDQFVLVIPKIRENVFNPEKQAAAKIITYSYSDIHAFINKDAKSVAKKIKRKAVVPPEQMQEYLDCMSIIAADCVEICLEKFRADIEEYRSKKHVSWSARVSSVQIVENEENQEGEKIKVSTSDEELKDDQGNSKKWRKEFSDKRSSKRPKTDDGNSIS